MIQYKIKNGESDIVYKPPRTFLSMNCRPNFTALTIHGETRRYSRRQETYKLLKHKAFQAGIVVKERPAPSPKNPNWISCLPHYT